MNELLGLVQRAAELQLALREAGLNGEADQVQRVQRELVARVQRLEARERCGCASGGTA